jgi:hypothetical protein
VIHFTQRAQRRIYDRAMKRALSLLGFFVATAASAQIVSIGSVAGIDAGLSFGATAIDMTHPANANGQVTTASIRMSANSTCSGSVKLKVVRLDVASGVFTVLADRGPFTVVAGANHLTLTPPVDVQAGDLVATVVQPGSCDSVSATHAGYGDFSLISGGDFASGRTLTGFTVNREIRPLVQLTGTDTLLAGVIPAIGALQGGFGAFFRTSVQFANPANSTSFIQVVFHAAGVSAQPNDPVRTFSLAPFTTSTHPDLISEMGLSGLGSMDVIVTSGPPPVVTARVFNDNGSAGTAGFYEDLVAPRDFMHPGDGASFTLPGDPANFRVNVGVRTLGATQLTVGYFEPSGGTPIGGTIFKSYAANYYEQVPLSSLLNGQQAIPGGLIIVRIVTGDAVVYFSTTDNRTNDTSATILRPQS